MKAKDPVFMQAWALLTSKTLKRKIARLEPETAFVLGYSLAQVCHRCGDLLKHPKPGRKP